MKSYKVKSFLGAGPSMQEASEWTSEQWESHEAYVEKLKAEGRYGELTETMFHFQDYPEFEDATPSDKQFGEFKLLIPIGKFKDEEPK